MALVVALLGRLDALLCVDRAHTYASGVGNGGAFVYELAADARTAARFAAYASIAGLPMRGFNRPPVRAPRTQ